MIMSKLKPTRRGFMVGCSSAVAAMAGARFTGLAFAEPESSGNNELLVVIFLRGGIDGLNLVMPISGADRGYYEAARAELAVPLTGSNAAIPLTAGFGLNPRASAFHDLYQANHLGFVMATGLTQANRSHFDAMEFMERGTPGNKTTSSGWLTRHLQSAENLPAQIIMPSVSVGNLQATSLLGSTDSVNMGNPDAFNINNGPWRWRDAQRLALRNLYTGDGTWLHEAGIQAMDAMDIIELNGAGDYTPAPGVTYPGGSFGNHLQVIAQLAKLGLGLRVAAIDLGGWDTHNGQGDEGQGFFGGRVEELSTGVKALLDDLDAAGMLNRSTVVIQSEFGRRLFENADRGTDHGHGNLMVVAGGNAVPGIHGTWPGLANAQLFDGADLEVTTDFRRVLSEILIRRMGNNRLGIVFPGYENYAPIGVVSGTDLAPDYTIPFFEDDFESGDVGRWSSSAG
jgi:uncharacterized protein (DUF1501 family)